MNTDKKVPRYFAGEIFLAQFVISLDVEGCPRPAIQITSHIFTSVSVESAYEHAKSMINSLSYSYRNKEGQVVTTTCEGLHCVEALEYLDGDDSLEAGVVQFSGETTISDLMMGANRKDLPSLE